MLTAKCESIKSLHYITYSTASSKSGLMPVFKLDKMVIKKKEAQKTIECMLGISFGQAIKSKNFDMLLGLKHIENLQ